MKLTKAIKLLTTAKEGWPTKNFEQYYKAMELGNEALNRIQAGRVAGHILWEDLLPGETAE